MTATVCVSDSAKSPRLVTLLLHSAETCGEAQHDQNSGGVGSALYLSQHINTTNKTLIHAVLVVAMFVCNFCNYKMLDFLQVGGSGFI